MYQLKNFFIFWEKWKMILKKYLLKIHCIKKNQKVTQKKTKGLNLNIWLCFHLNYASWLLGLLDQLPSSPCCKWTIRGTRCFSATSKLPSLPAQSATCSRISAFTIGHNLCSDSKRTLSINSVTGGKCWKCDHYCDSMEFTSVRWSITDLANRWHLSIVLSSKSFTTVISDSSATALLCHFIQCSRQKRFSRE